MLARIARVSTRVLPRSSRPSTRGFSVITRLHTEHPNMSQTVVNESTNTVYLAGQVPDDYKLDAKGQTKEVLAKIDSLLAEVGSDKSKLLQAQVWVKTMDDFGAVNEIWQSWVDPDNKPVRAAVEANMAHPDILVEVLVVAAK
ncbi:hypothetical protein AAMO2058_000928500 [Amorphochlora amoebiformis]|uniref:Uncharacterized protein n=1 Tax=Amorphochlora amoebiformis TaxID=1561963 RepID=A0A7S0CWV5_9EUKA|mmetsp:Transcript_14787/g.23378  ORF Transcript_14787/g.23378 Transcript_14787/m.23378 type:complete len:143 (+) Transcript_14787:29-457(+)